VGDVNRVAYTKPMNFVKIAPSSSITLMTGWPMKGSPPTAPDGCVAILKVVKASVEEGAYRRRRRQHSSIEEEEYWRKDIIGDGKTLFF
jgi:hypothetical protein